MSHSESESELSPAPGPECESPDPGRAPRPRLSNPPGPRPEDPHPGRGFEASPAPPCTADPPVQAPGELRSNFTKLAAGCAGLYLAWGGVQGPRRPLQLPGAPGCTTASARSPSGQSRPAARAGGGAATPPRPAPPHQGSPGVPAPRPQPPNDFPQSSVDPLSQGLRLGWWWQCRGRGGGAGRGKKGFLNSWVWIPSASTQATGRTNFSPRRIHLGSWLNVDSQGPPSKRGGFCRSGGGLQESAF